MTGLLFKFCKNTIIVFDDRSPMYQASTYVNKASNIFVESNQRDCLY